MSHRIPHTSASLGISRSVGDIKIGEHRGRSPQDCAPDYISVGWHTIEVLVFVGRWKVLLFLEVEKSIACKETKALFSRAISSKRYRSLEKNEGLYKCKPSLHNHHHRDSEERNSRLRLKRPRIGAGGNNNTASVYHRLSATCTEPRSLYTQPLSDSFSLFLDENNNTSLSSCSED